ncbi:MAG: cytochrome C, partial [Archangium sp.]|nr:cytochrome C [Archangium sp.]
SNLPELPALRALITTYDREVGLLNVAEAKKQNRTCPEGVAPAGAYVGSEACSTCHAAAATVWKGTKHSGAYQALETAGKQHHLDCVGCHVTGWLKPGGSCRVDRPGALTQVGCEACHGPGGAHVRSPSQPMKRQVEATTCTGCHDRENSPHFSFDSYVAKILGPGHGQ